MNEKSWIRLQIKKKKINFCIKIIVVSEVRFTKMYIYLLK